MLSALISIFYLCIRYCSLELKKNIVRFSHENIRIFKEFTSIVNMLRALILLTRKCHNIIKHSFNENIKELGYLLISYFYTFHTPHFPHSVFSTLRTPHPALLVFHRTRPLPYFSQATGNPRCHARWFCHKLALLSNILCRQLATRGERSR